MADGDYADVVDTSDTLKEDIALFTVSGQPDVQSKLNSMLLLIDALNERINALE